MFLFRVYYVTLKRNYKREKIKIFIHLRRRRWRVNMSDLNLMSLRFSEKIMDRHILRLKELIRDLQELYILISHERDSLKITIEKMNKETVNA